MLPGNDASYFVEIPITGDDCTVTTYMGAGYDHSAILPEGYLWEVVNFHLTASTDVTHTTNLYTYTLADSSGNSICTLTTGNIDVNPSTAVDSTPTAAYATIDTSSAADWLKVTGAISGTGNGAILGLRAIVELQRKRPA